MSPSSKWIETPGIFFSCRLIWDYRRGKQKGCSLDSHKTGANGNSLIKQQILIHLLGYVNSQLGENCYRFRGSGVQRFRVQGSEVQRFSVQRFKGSKVYSFTLYLTPYTLHHLTRINRKYETRKSKNETNPKFQNTVFFYRKYMIHPIFSRRSIKYG